MEENSGEKKEGFSVPVTMNLGAIEMTLEELVSLRPGMRIEFEKPPSFAGTLQLGNRDWACVEIKIEANSIVVSVESILGGENQKVSDLRETFAGQFTN